MNILIICIVSLIVAATIGIVIYFSFHSEKQYQQDIQELDDELCKLQFGLALYDLGIIPYNTRDYEAIRIKILMNKFQRGW